MSLQVPFAIAIGGSIGALLRHYTSAGVVKLTGDELSYMGTVSVNLAGCFAIGILATVADRTTALSPTMQRCLITGLLGSLTTFSTFALDSLKLLQAGRLAAAIGNTSVNLIAGILLVWLGTLLAGTFLPPQS